MSGILDNLTGGDRRSIGQSDQVVRKVIREPALIAEIIRGLSHANPPVRMRSADVAEKVTRVYPAWLGPHKNRLLELAAQVKEKELRWRLAQMLPRLHFDRAERARSMALMRAYLKDSSSIVRTFAMQALADLTANDAAARRKLLPCFEELAVSGSPAMRARARKLIALLSPARRS